MTLQNFKSSELLFDNETQGSGMFLPELPHPEHSNAHNTMLWEITLLKVIYVYTYLLVLKGESINDIEQRTCLRLLYICYIKKVSLKFTQHWMLWKTSFTYCSKLTVFISPLSIKTKIDKNGTSEISTNVVLKEILFECFLWQKIIFMY